MRGPKSKNEETKRLIELYDSFKMAEFMDSSSRSSDPNIMLMRKICAAFDRWGERSQVIDHDRGCFEKVLTLAESGDCVAQTNIGMCYRAGVDADPDPMQAILWLERAAEQGYPRAQSSLARALMDQDPVKNWDRAKRLLRQSANQGCAAAMCNLGVNFAERGDFQEAERYFKRAIDAGFVSAYPGLCQLYAEGHDGSPDMGKLYKCLREAWEHGQLESALKRGDVERLSFGSPCSRSDLGRFWLSGLHEADLCKLSKKDLNAKTYLAYLLMDGTLGFAKDEVRAKKLFEQAAKKGNPTAQCLLGECLYHGRGCKRNVDEAFRWFSVAAEKNQFQAVGWLATMYHSGEGCSRNIKLATKYTMMASRLGNEGAQSNLAMMYLHQIDSPGVKYDPTKAVELLWPLACHGRATAIARLGCCYMDGVGVQCDEKRGKRLLVVAEKLGACRLPLALRPEDQDVGYLRFFEAALGRDGDIDASIMRMLQDSERNR